MKVIDHQPSFWFLLEEKDSLFVNCLCNHSAYQYSWMIELNPEEITEYRNKGRGYISELAQDIHYTAPVAKGSTSKYINRNAENQYGEKVSAAIAHWWQQQKS